MKRLRRKAIVIIGGTSGLGLSAARAFLREGAQIVFVGRTAAKVRSAARELGSSATGLTGDAADAATAPKAIQLAIRNYGRFDGLYHVAGGSGRSRGDGRLHEITDAGWAYTVEENLTSLFHSNRAAVCQFLKQGTGGTVLNLSSVLAWSPSPKHFSSHAYVASKAAILGLTRSCAASYAADNIRFNALAPGLVATPMSGRAQANDDIMKFIGAKQPLDGGRIGAPEDLDGAAVWLMSDAAKFVTGQIIAVDGGWSVTGEADHQE